MTHLKIEIVFLECRKDMSYNITYSSQHYFSDLNQLKCSNINSIAVAVAFYRLMNFIFFRTNIVFAWLIWPVSWFKSENVYLSWLASNRQCSQQLATNPHKTAAFRGSFRYSEVKVWNIHTTINKKTYHHQ